MVFLLSERRRSQAGRMLAFAECMMKCAEGTEGQGAVDLACTRVGPKAAAYPDTQLAGSRDIMEES